MENKEVDTAYIVELYTDGTFAAMLELPEQLPTVARKATPADLVTVSEQLIKEIDHAQLTERIVVTLLSVLQQQTPPSPADAVKDKLKERGINPEGPVVNE
jgi:hypothetical protein